MKELNDPGNICFLLEDVLTFIEKEKQKFIQNEPITAEIIEEGKRMLKSLNFCNPDIDALKKALIILCRAVKKCTSFTNDSGDEVEGYFPRLTQLASLLLLLMPQRNNEKGCLLEIGTGEGKTCILAMFATIQATRGTTVDIVTSSPLFALRDQEEWEKLYKMFDVTSSTVPPLHKPNCSAEDYDKLLEKAYKQQVVYGTVSNFAADILRQEFDKKTTRGSRKFECVIVDEVDYMTLDSGVQVTFLSHQTSGLRHVEQILASLWALMSVCQPVELHDTGEIQWATRIQHFHTVMKCLICSESEDISAFDILMLGTNLGFYSQKDVEELHGAETRTQTETDIFQNDKKEVIERLMAKVGPEKQYSILSELLENNSCVDCYSLVNHKAKLYGKESSDGDADVRILLLENGRACEILSEKCLLKGVVDKLKSKMTYSDDSVLHSPKKSKKFVVIPSFLRNYIENQLPVFAENALNAIRMTEGREYMIDRAPEANRGVFSGEYAHHFDAVIPVDFEASGVLEKNKRWGDGLQQFLEMKHQLAISQLSSVTNFMSNTHFFKKYLTGYGIFGVTGTLGGKAEKAFLERHFRTASYVIPAHRRKNCIELPPIQVSRGYAQWIQKICETTQRAADRGQVILIICEDVKTADELKTKMLEKNEKITMYTISEKHNIEKQNFSQGNIIIATNLGGRGTDIHVQDDVNDLGGLFVLLTYFPVSHRVERQVFGRTARKGNPGTVQMILNQDHLAPAYQGHSMETMRQLREEYELIHLDSMEKNELRENEIKESLFSMFCEFLCDFDKNYSKEEKSDLSQMEPNNVPEYFKNHQSKFDYQVAVNALKESWALWLILHKEHITRHDDVKSDLTEHLKETGGRLLQGQSNNFYDYINQAKGRTELQWRSKVKCDYGAVDYWESAVKCDPFYKAVARYNQAGITLNLKNKSYMSEAKRLLEEAKTAVDVYFSESTNTMMCCNLSVTGAAVPHHKDTNLQTQMQIRMNIFKSWKGYIESVLTALSTLENANSEAIVIHSNVHHLLKDNDPITTNELMALDGAGLNTVFEVKKKPEFSFDALTCFLFGCLQVAGGILVCTLSYGAVSHIGRSLICEGVSDMVEGIKGMITGSFDWAKWAISKAISIGLSLICGGFSKLKKASSLVCRGAKGPMTGAKTVSSFTAKQCFKQAAKYTVQELGKQGFNTVFSCAVDKGITVLFQKTLEDTLKTKVLCWIKGNHELDKVLTDYVCSGIPSIAVQHELSGVQVSKGCETQIRQTVDLITKQAIPSLMMNCTKIHQVLDTCSFLTKITGLDNVKYVEKSLEISSIVTTLVKAYKSFPSEDLINKNFVPQLLQIMENLLREKKYDQDERHNLPDVKRLKNDLLKNIAESVSESFAEVLAGHATTILNKIYLGKINHAAGCAVRDVLGRKDTQAFFDNQVFKHLLSEAIPTGPVSCSNSEEKLKQYTEEIFDVAQTGTALDIHVLTQSNLLMGKGIKLCVVDKDGKKLTEDYFPGSDNTAGDIVLQLKKEPKNVQWFKKTFSNLKKL
ncbi:uncharacterized protein KZ484_010211 isoform 2-T2 [Pholidichthys leucotaenia]